MTRKELKIGTNEEIKRQFKFAKTEIDADTHEETLIRLILLCAENGELDVVDTDVLKDRLEDGH
jgi:hypothetical protein